MSRIGKLAIKIPDKVKVTAQPGLVNVEGPKGKVAQKLDREMKVTVDKGEVRVDRPNDSRRSRQLHGLTRTLVANMIQGVTQGFSRSLDIAGVGYKAELKGKEIHLALGFSHPVVYPLPEGVTAEYDAKGNRLTVKGADKHRIGLVAAEIRKLRPPEPYKGKGIKYAEETIRRKQGKTGAAATTLSPELKDGKGKKKELAKEVGKLVAKKCQEKQIAAVVFDRNGFMYHGRIAAVAEGAREGGLKF